MNTPRVFLIVWSVVMVWNVVRVIRRLNKQGGINPKTMPPPGGVQTPSTSSQKISTPMLSVLTLLGAGLFLGGLWSANESLSYVQHGEHARGQITGMIEHTSKNGVSYTPRVRFMTSSGMEINFVAGTPSNASSWPAVGEYWDVLYFPQKPEKARLNCFADLWIHAILLSLFSIPFLIFAIVNWKGRLSSASSDHWPPNPPPKSDPYSSPSVIR